MFCAFIHRANQTKAGSGRGKRTATDEQRPLLATLHTPDLDSEASGLRARNRWHLLLTLSNNPELAAMRKHAIDASINDSPLEEYA